MTTTPKHEADEPTITLKTEPGQCGTWTASMVVSGLRSEQEAKAAMAHMERLFCGEQIQQND